MSAHAVGDSEQHAFFGDGPALPSFSLFRVLGGAQIRHGKCIFIVPAASADVGSRGDREPNFGRHRV
jgi:hypothetical protein